MRKLFTSMLMALPFMFTAQAAAQAIAYRADIPERYRAVYERKIQGKTLTHSSTISPEEAIAAQRERLAASRADETTHTLTMKLTYDQDKEERPDFVAWGYDASVDYPDIFEMGFFDEEAGAYTFNIKPGTYNFWLRAASPRGMIFLVKENVTINSDMTLSLDTREADNHITFKTLNKEGEEIKDDLLDPSTGYTTVLDPGNIAEMTWNIDLHPIYNGHDAGGWSVNSFRMLNDDGTISSIAQNNWSVWVNDNSCMAFGRVDTYGDASGMGYVRHYAPECKTVEIVNDPADYVTVAERIIPTPHIQAIDPDDEFAFEIKSCANTSAYCVFKEGIPVAKSFNSLTTSGEMEGVDNSAETIAFYNLQGIKIERPEPGNIYIEVMSDGSSRKASR